MMMMIDASLLRNALRVVHCIQKERGASCAYFAFVNHHQQHQQHSPSSHHAPNLQQLSQHSQHFEIAMQQARLATNVAIQLLTEHVEHCYHNHHHHFHSSSSPPPIVLPLRNNLEKIRTLIDGTTMMTITSQQDELAFHRIFVCFNTLVNFVATEYVLKQTEVTTTTTTTNPTTPTSLSSKYYISSSSPRKQQQGLHHPTRHLVVDPFATTTTTTTPKMTTPRRRRQQTRHHRGLSSDINDKLSSAWKMSPKQAASGGSGSFGGGSGSFGGGSFGFDATTGRSSGKTKQITLKRIESNDTDEKDMDDDDEDEENGNLDDNDGSSSTIPPPPPPLPPSSSPSFSPEQQRHELMDLLNCFVQLKESTGIERGILSSLLAFQNAATIAATPSTAAAAAAEEAVPPVGVVQNMLSDLLFQVPSDTSNETKKDNDNGIPIVPSPTIQPPPSSTAATTTTSSSSSSISISSTSSRLLSDLIVEVENQRRLIAKLNDLPDNNQNQNHQNTTTSGPTVGMSHLVLELAQLSPSLQELQDQILTNPGEFLHPTNQQQQQHDNNNNENKDDGTCTTSIKYDSEGIFQVITIYMDKLHSLELLIIEELESCCQSTTTATTSIRQPVSQERRSIPSPFMTKHKDDDDDATSSSSRNIEPSLPLKQPTATTSTTTTATTLADLLPPTQQQSSSKRNLIHSSSSMSSTSDEKYRTTTSTRRQQQSLSQALHQHSIVVDGSDKEKEKEGTFIDFVLTQLETLSPQTLKDRILIALQQEAIQAQKDQQQRERNQSSTSEVSRTTSTSQGAMAESLDEKINTALTESTTILTKKVTDPSAAAASTTKNGAPLDSNTISTNKSSTNNNKEWEIGIYEVKFQRRIGQGACGTTYRATWSGQSVAVKVASITDFGLEGWRTEVAALQKLHHPNVIRLLGCVYHENPLTFCLVLEYCNAGDLATAIKYPTPRNFFFNVVTPLANAMAYLHSRHIIHRDLKPANVLCDGNITNGNFTIKVTDFGLATPYDGGGNGIEESQQQQQQQHMMGSNRNDGMKRHLTGETGTYRWMAPEVFRHEAYGNMADVYSFAIVVWQMLTREDPFHTEDDSGAVALRVATEQARPPLPEATPLPLKELIQTCWQDDATKRWKFDHISEVLQGIQKQPGGSLTSEQKAWLENPDGHPVYHEEEPVAPPPPMIRLDGPGGGGKKGGGGKGVWAMFGGGHKNHHKGKHG